MYTVTIKQILDFLTNNIDKWDTFSRFDPSSIFFRRLMAMFYEYSIPLQIQGADSGSGFETLTANMLRLEHVGNKVSRASFHNFIMAFDPNFCVSFDGSNERFENFVKHMLFNHAIHTSIIVDEINRYVMNNVIGE